MKRISTTLTCLLFLAACSSEENNDSESVEQITNSNVEVSTNESNNSDADNSSDANSADNDGQVENNGEQSTSIDETATQEDTAEQTSVTESSEQTQPEENTQQTENVANTGVKEETAVATPLEAETEEEEKVTTGLRSDKQRLEQNADSAELEALIENLNQQAFEDFKPVYHQVQHFSMLYPATNGEAKTEMESFLKINNSVFSLSPTLYLQSLNQLDMLLTQTGDVSSKASIWGDDNYPFAPGFADVLTQHFAVTLNSQNISADSDLLKEETKYWIRENNLPMDNEPYVRVNENTKLIIASNHYAKLDWAHGFSTENNTEQTFFALSHESQDVPMMSQQMDVNFYTDEKITFVDVPLQNSDWSIYLIKTNEVDDFSNYQASFNHQSLIELIDQSQLTTVNLTLPKIIRRDWIGFSNEFNNVNSKSLADLSNINQSVTADTYVSASGGASAFAFDENGIKTSFQLDSELEIKPDPEDHFPGSFASVTIRDFSYISWLIPVQDDTPVEATFDRPFMYFVLHKPTGAVMYLGKVTSAFDDWVSYEITDDE